MWSHALAMMHRCISCLSTLAVASAVSRRGVGSWNGYLRVDVNRTASQLRIQARGVSEGYQLRRISELLGDENLEQHRID